MLKRTMWMIEKRKEKNPCDDQDRKQRQNRKWLRRRGSQKRKWRGRKSNRRRSRKVREGAEEQEEEEVL